MSNIRTPPIITPMIRAFCDEIAPGPDPVYLRIRTRACCKPSECYRNAWAVATRHGGEVVHGWAITDWPGAYLEAEHHAVVRFKGELVDVTPQPYAKVLFVPDPTRPCSKSAVRPFPNMFKVLVDDPVVTAYLGVFQRFRELTNNSQREVRIDAVAFGALQRDAVVIVARMEEKYSQH